MIRIGEKYFFQKLIFVIVFVYLLLFSLYFLLYNVDMRISEERLSVLIDEKMEKIEYYLLDMEEDAENISGFYEIKDLFDMRLVQQPFFAEEDSVIISKRVAENLESFLRDNSDMSVEDLMGSEEFASLAVQPVGKTGYTYVVSKDTGIIYFHLDPVVVGNSYEDFKEESFGVWKAIDDIAKQNDSCLPTEAYYSWEDIAGSVRDKYSYNRCLNVKTKDGETLIVGASVYLDEYRTLDEVALEVENISKKVAREVDDYILGHQDMTLSELKNSVEFQNLFVQSVGKTGHTYVIGGNGEFLAYFDAAIKSGTYEVFKNDFPKMWQLMDDVVRSSECESSSGVYSWCDFKGVSKEEYVYHACSEKSTKDGFRIIVGAAANLDDYRLLRPVPENIKIKSHAVSKQIETYLLNHPNMTLYDLRDSEEFYGLFVQQVGLTGYTTIVSCDEPGEFIAYINPLYKNMTYHVVKEGFPKVWKIINEIIVSPTHEENFGFYPWAANPGEEPRYKYTHQTCTNETSADGHPLLAGATTFLDDYKTLAEVPFETDDILAKFIQTQGYSDLAIVSPDGYVLHKMENFGDLGVNLDWPEHLDTGISRSYRLAKESLNVSVFGPFFSLYDEGLFFFVSSPIYNNGGELLGFIILINSAEDFLNIVSGGDDFANSYLVNRDLNLVTPLKRDDFGVFVQSVNTDNSNNCFEGKTETEKFFLDYRGDKVFGVNRKISGLDSCLLVENDVWGLFDLF